MIEQGRAVLVGTHSIADSIDVAEQLQIAGLSFQLLNGVQDTDEAKIVSMAGQQGAITVATNMAGRGTDIALDAEVRRNGGLHVIVTQQHLLERVDRQLIGRSARCGDPGSARIFVSAEDQISTEIAPWIGRAIERWDACGRHTSLEVAARISRIQRDQQRLATSRRWRMLQTDQQDERLFAKTDESPHRCVAL